MRSFMAFDLYQLTKYPYSDRTKDDGHQRRVVVTMGKEPQSSINCVKFLIT